MAASKQARTYTNTLAHCSPTSVGLAQARPNYIHKSCKQCLNNSLCTEMREEGIGKRGGGGERKREKERGGKREEREREGRKEEGERRRGEEEGRRGRRERDRKERIKDERREKRSSH